MPFEDPNDVADPTDDDDILSAWGDAVRKSLMAGVAGPTASVRRSTNQSVGDDTNVGIDGDALDWDSHTIHTVVGGVSRFTVPAGWDGGWEFTMNTNWQANNLGMRSAFIKVNGALVIAGVNEPAGWDGTCQQYVSRKWQAVAGDYFEFFVNQNCGAGLNLEPIDYGFQVITADWYRLPHTIAAA